jgi:hypothetical protein
MMPVDVKFIIDSRQLQAIKGVAPAIKRALYKAGSTALRDMRSEASKRVRARKRIKAKYVRDSLVMARPKGKAIDGAEWTLKVKGDRVPLRAYPTRQTKKGVSAQVNTGKRSLVPGAFIARMRSGHEGVFKRVGAKRLPIRELYGSRPVDALLHKGEAEAVQQRGGDSMSHAFERLLPLELGKLAAKSGNGES